MAAMIRAHLGDDSIEETRATPGGAALCRVYSKWKVFIDPRAPIIERLFNSAHELAEWYLKVVRGYDEDDAELVANYIAGAIVVPARAFRIARAEHGPDLGVLAGIFRTSETCIALREAEIDRLARAVVTKRKVYARGPDDFVWGTEEDVRRLAQRPGPGLAKCRLGDDPTRIRLDVAA